jgi:hypothetical protein
VKVDAVAGLPKPNRYQKDFLHLRSMVDEAFPNPDRYFPPPKRASIENDILSQLGAPDTTYETFVFSLHRYLAAFSNQHAVVQFNPKPIRYSIGYPFQARYFSNELYLADIAREYDASLLGQRITAINDRPLAEVEQTLSGLVCAETARSRRALLQPYFSRPDLYRVCGLISSASNSVKLDFASHPPVTIRPIFSGNPEWHQERPPTHSITARTNHQYDLRIVPKANLAYLQFNACFDKTAILDGLETHVRPWMRPLVRAWLAIEFRRKEPSSILRGIYDPQRPVFKDYLAAAIREIDRQGITNLVIDLRRNAGGQVELGNQLLYHLAPAGNVRGPKEFVRSAEVYEHYNPEEGPKLRKWQRQFGSELPPNALLPLPANERPFLASITDRESPYYVEPGRPVFRGRIVALVNENTGSSAALLAVLLQDNGLATLVGTTTANFATGPTALTPFKLPRSGIMVSVPSCWLERPDVAKGENLEPDIWAENSMADIQAGRDAVFEKALEIISASPP